MSDTQSEMEAQLREVQRCQELHVQQSELDASRELLSSLWAESARYTTVVIVAGYAAFFTVWASMRDSLAPNVRSWSVSLILVSLLIFMAWEMTKMVLTGVLLRRLDRAASAVGATPTQFKAVLEHQIGPLQRLWPRFLIPAAVSGFTAGLVLLVAFVGQIVESFSPATR